MNETVSSLQNEYRLECEKARMDREENGDYTKAGLRHMDSAARIQLRLADMTAGEMAQLHRTQGYQILKDVHRHMQRLGLIPESKPEVPTTAQPVEDPNATAPTDVLDEDDGDPMEELNSLIGLENAKETIVGIINQLCNNRQREERGLKKILIPMHMVFTGNPGTGKTTVARIVAGILKKNGLLSKGHLVEVKSHDLIKGFVGQTGGNTQEVIDKAKGGILFIDEAYALANNQFGRDDCIPVLLTAMENNRDDLAVIVAGYTDDMRKFVKSNSGLTSRFTHFVHFEDYSAGQLFAIFKSKCAKKDLILSEEAENVLKTILAQKEYDASFGNARGVRNLLSFAYEAQSSRLQLLRNAYKPIDNSTLMILEASDIQFAGNKINQANL